MGMRANIQPKESGREDLNVSESSSFCSSVLRPRAKAGAYVEVLPAPSVSKFQPASAFHLPGYEEPLSPLRVWPPEAPGPLRLRHETVLLKKDPGQPAWV